MPSKRTQREFKKSAPPLVRPFAGELSSHRRCTFLSASFNLGVDMGSLGGRFGVGLCQRFSWLKVRLAKFSARHIFDDCLIFCSFCVFGVLRRPSQRPGSNLFACRGVTNLWWEIQGQALKTRNSYHTNSTHAMSASCTRLLGGYLGVARVPCDSTAPGELSLWQHCRRQSRRNAPYLMLPSIA